MILVMQKQVITEDEEGEVMALKDRLAVYNLDSSPEPSEGRLIL